MPPLKRLIGGALLLAALVEGGARVLRDGTGLVRSPTTDTGRRLLAQAAGSPLGDRLGWHPRWGWQPLPGDGADERGVVQSGAGERVIVLGDERALEPWARELDCGCERMNLAAPGYGLDQQLLRFVEQGLMSTPRVVVLALDTRALTASKAEWDLWRKPRFGFDGALTPPAGNAPRPESAATEGPWLAAQDVATALVERLTAPVQVVDADPFVLALLDGLRAEVEAAGAKLVVVWLPSDHPREAVARALVEGWQGTVTAEGAAAAVRGALSR